MKKRFFRKLWIFNMARSLTLPVFVFALPVFLSLAAISLYIYCSASSCSDVCFIFISSGFISGIVLFFILLYLKKETTKQSAEVLDELVESYNSFETSVELAGKGHVLENAQLALSVKMMDADAGKPLKNAVKHLRISKEVLAVTLVTAVVFSFILPLYSKTDTGALAHIKHAKMQNKIAEVPDVTASLSINYPEPESSAKPIDEIEWDGRGTVSTSFRKVSLEIFINGELKKEITLEKENIVEENGMLRFSGTFFIGDTGAEPFDVMSYNLKGEAVAQDGRIREFYSQPQFTEIQPLKEDILIMDGMGGDYTEIAESVKLFIKLQMMLNRVTYAAKSLGSLGGNQEVALKMKELQEEQKRLHAKLQKYILDNKNKDDSTVLLTPEMLICLERAADEMNAAAEKIRKASGGSEQ